jgi:hypothetical protein
VAGYGDVCCSVWGMAVPIKGVRDNDSSFCKLTLDFVPFGKMWRNW